VDPHTFDSAVTLGNGNNDLVNVGGLGANGNTIIVGNGNGDVVNDSGGSFNTMTVGNGNDTIYLGNSDTVTVGKGQDSLVFEQATPGDIGAATINGFANVDVIDLSLALFASYSAMLSAGDIVQSGSNTVITDHAGDNVTLTGVTASSLTASNFKFG
jgi:hypothetical protein